MRATTTSLCLSVVVVSLAGAGCRVNGGGIAGLGMETGGSGGSVVAGSGGAGGATDPDGADAGAGCASLPIPAIACAVGRTVPVCRFVLMPGEALGHYVWTISCPDEPGVDAGRDATVSDTASDSNKIDSSPGTDALRADVPGNVDVRGADQAEADAGIGKACTGNSNCADGQICTTLDGVCNPPPGCSATVACPAVCYGTCRSARTGPSCGNSLCAMGMECCNSSCGTCVAPGGGCTKQICVAPSCTVDSDCQTFSDYCTGCDCRSVRVGAPAPVCPGPGVSCLIDPCFDRAARCVSNRCVLVATR